MINPKITVITPTFNRASLISQTIESVLAQTFIDFEYYILDDGSIDNTKDIVQPYLKDTRIKYLYRENQGEAETVNWGWSLASGEYFVQINSDDTVLPEFFFEMVQILDKNSSKVLAYPDFNFIDENNSIISITRSPDWNFIDALINYSCYAASVGTFLRMSAFLSWTKIKKPNFKHINDTEMYWNMALVGDFIHVPKVLANWRVHSGQISADRYQAIPEIEQWFNNYFFKNNLPQSISVIKDTVRQTLYRYYIQLILDSSLPFVEKKNKVQSYLLLLSTAEIKKKQKESEFNCLQISDNDLIGNKFNGHDLHLYLQEKNVDAVQLVRDKYSNDKETFVFTDFWDDNFTKALIKNPLFLFSDIIHLHLIHLLPFDLNYLSLISKLKPIVITLHDPFFLGGHCIYHFDCKKWQTHCFDCQYLDKPFAIEQDTVAVNFELKKQAIQNSQITVIVASRWMEEKVKKSPIWQGKKLYYLPFGINQDLFKPVNSMWAKEKLRITKNSFTLMFRSDTNLYKGLDILKNALEKLNSNVKITLITVAQKGLFTDLAKKYNIMEYDWIKDDNIMVDLYQACDLFLMPSRQEAFGMMAIEAMSCGKMVLALDCEDSALSDVINSPECGIAVKESDYAEELQRLVDNPQEIIDRANKSLEYAQKHYNKDVYIDRMITIYKEVMTEHVMDDSAQLILDQLLKYSVDRLLTNQTGFQQLQNSAVKPLEFSPTSRFASLYFRLKKYDWFNKIWKKIRPLILKLYKKTAKFVDKIKHK